jgi:hypothetical protein
MHRTPRPRFQRQLLPAIVLVLTTAAMTGCSADSKDRTLRADLQAIRSIHGDPDAIGSLDATAPPADLAQYRHATAHRLKPAI